MIIPIAIPTTPRHTAEQKLIVEALIIFPSFGTVVLYSIEPVCGGDAAIV
jgi:hypothetical protein